MTNFRPGDRVRVVDTAFGCDLDPDRVYTVSRVGAGELWLEEDPGRGWVKARFAHAPQPTARFEPGDTVQCRNARGTNLVPGGTYKVDEVEGFGSWTFLKLNGDPERTYGGRQKEYDADRFEMVEAAKQQPQATEPPGGWAALADVLDEVEDAWLLMDNSGDNPNARKSVAAALPAGGLECMEQADKVIDLLRRALGKTPINREGEPEDDQPYQGDPGDETDQPSDVDVDVDIDVVLSAPEELKAMALAQAAADLRDLADQFELDALDVYGEGEGEPYEVTGGIGQVDPAWRTGFSPDEENEGEEDFKFFSPDDEENEEDGLVSRVARALVTAWNDETGHPDTLDDLPEDDQAVAFAQAHAAIEAVDAFDAEQEQMDEAADVQWTPEVRKPGIEPRNNVEWARVRVVKMTHDSDYGRGLPVSDETRNSASRTIAQIKAARGQHDRGVSERIAIMTPRFPDTSFVDIERDPSGEIVSGKVYRTVGSWGVYA
jgi:hypothetical protein